MRKTKLFEQSRALALDSKFGKEKFKGYSIPKILIPSGERILIFLKI